VASEGDRIHPDLVLKVYDEFGLDASTQGVRLGQPIGLEVVMINNKNVYVDVRPEVCIASNTPELSHPKAHTYLLLYNG
jgi:hypothetical protein